MLYVLAQIISSIARLFTLIVLVDVVLTYFMDPYHPVRMALDRLVNPFLSPIRRLIPAIAMLDFSPLILIILVQLISNGLVNLLLYMAR
ncbi:MAG: YggT family protein [Chloroflexi bacterium]|nr:MAG: YggT family protein [Chloroflexota bacterium]